MNRNRPRVAVAIVTGLAGIVTLLALPAFSSALLSDATKGLNDTTKNLQGQLGQGAPKLQLGPQQGGGSAPAAPVAPSGNTPSDPGGYQPPLHGENPHGQGTAGTVDLAPSPERPYGADAAGPGEVVVGRSRGEQRENGDYRGRVVVAGLFGEELIGVETDEGEEDEGPLGPINDALGMICDGSGQSVCLEVLAVESSTTGRGSRNRFAAVDGQLGGPAGIRAAALESEGNIREDDECQRAVGSSSVADAGAGPITVSAAQSRTESEACRGGPRTQSHESSVINLAGSGVPLPAPGCANGTPDTVLNLIIAQTVCNADDTNGVGESDGAQTARPYGVREALTGFVLPSGGTAALKLTTAASESHAVAPARPDDPDPDDRCPDGSRPPCSEPPVGPPGGPPTGPPVGPPAGAPDGPPTVFVSAPSSPAGSGGPTTECSDGIDNDGDGRVDFPDDPECDSASDDSESGSLPRTGLDVLWVALLGAMTLAAGASLYGGVGRWQRNGS